MAAAAEPKDPIDSDMLDRAISRTRRNAGKGADQIGSADLRNLPREARRALADLLKESEAKLAWPWQMLISIILLQGKLSGGDRPIGLICMLQRLWELIRQPPMQQWTREKAGFGDQAVAQSPALRCALLRSAAAESASASGFETAMVMVDLEKFYDTICMADLIRLALKLEMPATTLYLDLPIYLSPRFFAIPGSCFKVDRGRGELGCWLKERKQLGASGPLRYIGARAQFWASDLHLRVGG